MPSPEVQIYAEGRLLMDEGARASIPLNEGGPGYADRVTTDLRIDGTCDWKRERIGGPGLLDEDVGNCELQLARVRMQRLKEREGGVIEAPRVLPALHIHASALVAE